MKEKDKESLTKVYQGTVTLSRGHYNELPLGLTKEFNSVTKQIFHHSCPMVFNGHDSSVTAMNSPCFLPEKILNVFMLFLFHHFKLV